MLATRRPKKLDIAVVESVKNKKDSDEESRESEKEHGDSYKAQGVKGVWKIIKIFFFLKY
jgi:hypothetical protein